MRQSAKNFRKETSDEQAKDIAQRIRAIDYELMSIVTGGSNIGLAPLNVKAGDMLARMQRQLRVLRIEMEVERRFDTVPPEGWGWSRTLGHPWGPARGGERVICVK